jgi:DNA-binding NarL/FixJ family response regulator
MEAIKVKIYNASPLMYGLLMEIAKTREENDPFVFTNNAKNIAQSDSENTDVIMVVLGEKATANWKFVAELKTVQPNIPVLLLVRCSSNVTLQMALKYRVEGLITEEQSLPSFLNILRKLAEGEKHFDADAMIELTQENLSVLDHERKLLILIAQEKDRNAIAQQLKIDVRTVDLHLNALRKKLGVSTNMGLALYAKKVGLV